MFLLYHSDRCNTSETVFHWCYVNDLHTTHAVVCWVTTLCLPLGLIHDTREAVIANRTKVGVPGAVVRGQHAHPREGAVSGMRASDCDICGASL
jgi:hypothetical protein